MRDFDEGIRKRKTHRTKAIEDDRLKSSLVEH